MKAKVFIFFTLASIMFCGETWVLALEVIGHRGSRGTRPENTLAAFEEAIEAQADGMHLDVQMTKEEEVVIYHDFFLNPDVCQYLDGSPISKDLLANSLSLPEIQKIDCGNKAHPKYLRQIVAPGSRILTLPEFLEWMKINPHPQARKMQIIIKLRVNSHHSRRKFAEKVVHEVLNSGLQKRVVYASFDEGILSEIKSLHPEAVLCFAKAHTLDQLMETA